MCLLNFLGPVPVGIKNLRVRESCWEVYHTCLFMSDTFLFAHVMELILVEEAVRDLKMTGQKCPSGRKGAR